MTLERITATEPEILINMGDLSYADIFLTNQTYLGKCCFTSEQK